MKKIKGHVTGKLSLSILTVILLLVGVLAGFSRITSKTKAGSSTAAVNSATSSQKSLAAQKQDLESIKTTISKSPLVFEPNRGQTDSQVQYFARGAGYHAYLTGPSSTVMKFWPAPDVKKADLLTQKLVGANASSKPQAEELANSVSNYYIGADRSKWLERVPNYKKVRYSDVYPGIDVVYQGDNLKLRYDFEVKPGADPKAIQMAYEGASELRIDQQGNLVAKLPQGELTSSKPYIFQEFAGKKHVVNGGWTLTARNEARFEVGSYDHSQKLVIDPGLTFGAYMGSAPGAAFINQITGVTSDAGAVYYSGWTNSPALIPAADALEDAFVGKMVATTTSLGTTTNTFFGGPGNDRATGIATAGGTVYVSGVTNSGVNFTGGKKNTLTRANELNFNKHAFVASFAGGTGAPSSAILAGVGEETATGVAVSIDATGTTKVHVTGNTSSPDLVGANTPLGSNNLGAPAANAAQGVFGSVAGTNAFYVTLPPALTSVTYGSFLGGWNSDTAAAIAVDAKGDAYITGTSTSWANPPSNSTRVFPVQPPATCASNAPVGSVCIPATNPPSPTLLLNTFHSGTHAYVAAFNSAASNTTTSSSLLFSLPVGGDINVNEVDNGTAIAVDANFNVYVGGNTTGPSFGSGGAANGAIGANGLNNAVGTPGTNGSPNNNVVFTEPAFIDPNTGGSATGTGVVADISFACPGCTRGNGYTAGQVGSAVAFSAPDIPGGAQATGVIASRVGTSIATIRITNQGSGYTKAPTITFPAPAGNNPVQATAVVIMGDIVLGNPTPPLAGAFGCTPSVPNCVLGQDGWVISLITPGGVSAYTNGTFFTNNVPNNTTFPGLIYGTLVNGDETNGNGTGAIPPAGAISTVTGVVTDAGATPVVSSDPLCSTAGHPPCNGNPGAIGNAYISGSSTNTTFTGNPGQAAVPNQAVVIRRRINDNGIDVQHCCITNNLTQSPFLRNVANPITVIAWPVQGNAVTMIGDLPMGDATALAVGVGSITIVSPGSGYAAAPTISFVGGCVTEPTATATILNGGVSTIVVNTHGSGCVSAPQVVFTGANTTTAIATASLTAVGGGTGVTYETSTGRSCVAGSVPSTGGLALLGAPPASTLEGFVACATFQNDVTISSSAGSNLFFTLQAGTTQTATGTLGSPGITVIPLGTGGSAPQLVSVTNPNQLAHPITLIGPDYKPSAGNPANGPASATVPGGNPWLFASITNVSAGGVGINLSLTDPNNPTAAAPASFLDPGYYTATVLVIPAPGSGDNAGVPFEITVNLVVTGDVVTNSSIGGGVPANLTVNFAPGTGFSNVGNNPEVINIPVVSAVPLNSRSASDIVFDVQRDSNGDPVYINSNTQFPVLSPLNSPVSQNGNVIAVNVTNAGSGYPINTTGNGGITFSAPGCTINGTTCKLPVATFAVNGAGSVVSVTIVDGGAGYSNPPFVTFPIPPNPGGVQAQGAAVLGGSVGILLPGGTVNLRPTSGLLPGQTSCGATQFVPPQQFPQPEAGPALSNQFACYIQVTLPPNMLTGAPQGTYTGTFTLLVPAGTLNSPSNAPESVPPSPSQVITFQPQTITITVNVVGGGLLLTSPWVSNNFPYITNPPLNLAVPGISVCEGAPIGGTAGRCVAPFSIPEGFTGQIEDNNSGLGNTIPGITANNLNFSNVNLDTRNLGTTQSTALTATQIPFDSNMQLAMTETHLFAFAGINGALPIPTCTTSSPVLPAANLQTNFPATVPASNAVATLTALTIRVVNTAALANGYYSFAFRFSTTNGAGQTVFVDLPGCVSIGNHFRYDYLDDGLQPPQSNFNFGGTANDIVSGPPLSGLLFLEAGDVQGLTMSLLAIGPSQVPALPNPGGPQFAAPDNTLQIPASTALGVSACPDAPAANCNPTWYVTPTLGSWGFAGAPPVGDQLGTTCNGTLPVNSCTPIFHNLLVQPPQNTAAGAYEGGFKVTQPANATGVLKGNPSPMDALLPTDVSTGPSVILTALTDPAAVSSPTGTGSVAAVILGAGGSGYTSAPAITFAGGCTTEPIATAVVVGGAVTQIILNNPGSGCTSAPIVTIAPPTTPGGTQATAAAIVSAATLTVHFTDTVGSSVTIPASQLVGVLPSRPGINVQFVVVNNTGGNPLWLTGASVNLTNCTPAVFDPAQAEPGLFNGCEVTITPNPAIVATLPQGTYKAEVVLRAVGATPNIISINVQLDVLSGPTVIAPASETFTVNLCNTNVVVPASQPITLSLSQPLPTGTTSFLASAQAVSNGNVVLLNGGTTPVSITVNCTPGGTTCTTTPALSVTMAAPAGLSAGQVLNGTILFTVPASNGNQVVANPSFSVGVTANVVACTTASFAPASASTNFTVGQPVAQQTNFATTLTVLGSDSFNLTTTCGGNTPCPWASVTPTTTSSTSTPVTVTIDATKIPTTAGNKVATITATGVNTGATATYTLTVAVAVAPTITLNPAGPLTFNYVSGNPAPVVGNGGAVAISLTNTPQNPSIALTASSDNTTVCSVTQPGSVSNSGGSMNVTINQAAIQAPGTYTCNIKVSSVTAAMTAGPATLSITINTASPTLTSATPNPIIVDAPQGATAAINVPVSLTGTGTFTALANPQTLTPIGGNWLSVAGTGSPVQIQVTNGAATATVVINVGSLAPGQYVGSVAFSGPGTTTQNLFNLPVILNVGAITANPTSIGFNHTLGFTPASQQATLIHLTTTVPAGADSLGHNGLQFTAAATTTNGGNWLTVSPASGSVNASASTDLTVAYTVPTTCTPTAATPCVYNGNVAVSTTGTNTVINIPVTLTVFVQPTLSALDLTGLSINSVVFPPTVVGTQASPITFNLVANGNLQGGTLPFNLTFASAPAWLQVAPTSGTTTNAGTPITVSVNMAAFGANPIPGTYDGDIFITSPNAANSPLHIGVVLSLIAPTITPNPTSLTFTAVQNSGVVIPASQTVSFTSNGATLPITVASALPSWLNVTVSGQTATFTPILGSLAAGTYNATVLFFAPGAANSTIPVNVQFVVTPPQSCVITFNGGASTSISLPEFGTTTNGFIPLTSNTIAVASNGAPACSGVTWTASLATVCAANAPNGVCPTWAAITGGATGNLTAGGNISFTAMSNPKTAGRVSNITLTFTGGSSTIAPVTLTLNEAANTTESQAFREVRALYQTILGRDPDSAGFAFWTGQGAAALGSLTDSFLQSPESLGTDWITMLTYQGATGVAPSFSQFLQSVAAIRSGAQTPSTLFTSLAPAGLTVTQVYNNLLSRNPTSAELAASTTPLAAFNTIIASTEFHTGADSLTHTNQLFIRLLYYVTLSRDPDAGGLNFWTGLANGVGNGIFYTATSTARINNIIGTGSLTGFLGFVGSPEFQFLFQ